MIGIIFIILCTNILHLLNKKIYKNTKDIKNISLEVDPYNPNRAVTFLLDHGITGHVFNWAGYGGYLLWKTYPQLIPFVDGRVANREYYTEYQNISRFPEQYWESAYKKHKFDVVLLDTTIRYNQPIIEYINDDQDWRLVFISGSSIIFLNKDSRFFLNKSNNLPQKLKDQTFDLNNVPIDLADNLQPSDNFITDYIFPRYNYIDKMTEGLTLYFLSYHEAGLNRILDAYQATRHPRVKILFQQLINDYKKINLSAH